MTVELMHILVAAAKIRSYEKLEDIDPETLGSLSVFIETGDDQGMGLPESAEKELEGWANKHG